MFTGIVEEIGQVNSMAEGRLEIMAEHVFTDLPEGGSICVNGACLTVTGYGKGSFTTQVVPETLRRTNLGLLSSGDNVNLERPIPMGGRLNGHMVQGHVDGTGRVADLTNDGEALIVRVEAPSSIMGYIVSKGFVALDGTSLTVVDCDEDAFSVTIVPYTRTHTLLGMCKIGDIVNLEVDILAKYVERLSHKPHG